jgi:hypothetical protein
MSTASRLKMLAPLALMTVSYFGVDLSTPANVKIMRGAFVASITMARVCALCARMRRLRAPAAPALRARLRAAVQPRVR